MTDNGQKEFELKFELEPSAAKKIEHRLRPAGARTIPESQVQRSTYFDSREFDLEKAGVLLRVREMAGKRIQTVKSVSTDSIFGRDEFENEIATDRPDLHAIANTPLAPVMTTRIERRLRPLFRTQVERRKYIHTENGTKVEVALDQGRIIANRRWLPICELELELKNGARKDLYALARQIGRSLPMRLSITSKAARGYALLRHGSVPGAYKAQRVRLKRCARNAEAFQIIANGCLRQIMENVPATTRGDREALHQMRVGLRRLRTSITLFSDMIADNKRDPIKRELKWAAGELRAAQDLDALLAEIAIRMNSKERIVRDLEQLQKVLERKRATAYLNVNKALGSGRFRMLLLDVAAWI
jgi:triphosphatase